MFQKFTLLTLLEVLFAYSLLSFIFASIYAIPSIIYNPDFDAHEDAVDIHDAVKGPGTDEGTLLEIITDRTCPQRLEIAKAFQEIYDYDLQKRLGEDTSGSYEQLLKDSFICGDDIYIQSLWRALHNEFEHNNQKYADKSLIEILVIYSESAQKRQALLDGYQKTYNVALIDELKNAQKGEFLNALVQLATQRERQPRQLINEDEAQNTGEALSAESANWDDHREILDKTLLETCFEQLTAVFNAFQKVNGKDIEVVVKKKMKDPVRNLYQDLITFVRLYANYHREYYAIRLKEAVEGPGTHISCLIRTILYHSETDMKEIEDTFRIFNTRELRSKIAHDVSGDFEALMVAFLPRTPAEEEEKKRKHEERRKMQKERKKLRGAMPYSANVTIDGMTVNQMMKTWTEKQAILAREEALIRNPSLHITPLQMN